MPAPAFTWPHAPAQAVLPLPNDADSAPGHTGDATPVSAASVTGASPARHGEDGASVDAAHVAAAPSDSAILMRQARALADQGRLEEARTRCRTALGRDKLNVEAYLLLAAIAQELGESGAAQDALRRALYLDPRAPAAHFLLGSLLYRERDYRRARRAMETVLQLAGAFPRDQVIPACEGLTAGRLIETAQCYLASEAP